MKKILFLFFFSSLGFADGSLVQIVELLKKANKECGHYKELGDRRLCFQKYKKEHLEILGKFYDKKPADFKLKAIEIEKNYQ